jgi:hypothetical protein
MWKETNVMRTLRQPSREQIMMDQKQTGNVYYFNYWSSMIRNDTRRRRQITSRIAMSTRAFNKKSFQQQIWPDM